MFLFGQAYLEDALVAQQQVGCFKIAMEYPVVVEMPDSSEELNHQRLYFTYGGNMCFNSAVVKYKRKNY